MPSPPALPRPAGRALRTWALCCAFVAAPALAADPDAYDPLLDAPADLDAQPDAAIAREPPGTAGFLVSARFGLYMGAVKSIIRPEIGTLENSVRPAIGVGFGYRTRWILELSLDADLGLGRTYDRKVGDIIKTFDVLAEGRALFHVLESPGWGLYVGPAVTTVMFDADSDGLAQGGLGPTALVGVVRRLDRHSLLYLEAGWCRFYDVLAFDWVEPSAADLLEDPGARRYKDRGDWFNIFRVTLGYRLTGL